MSSSSDEGEIREDEEMGSKAITMPHSAGNGVDRSDRLRGVRSRSPESSYGSSRRDRSPRGSKRHRDYDAPDYRHGGGGSDPRRFKVHYEDEAPQRDKYRDLDRPQGARDGSYANKRARTRSSSPGPSRNGMSKIGYKGGRRDRREDESYKYSSPDDNAARGGSRRERDHAAGRRSDHKHDAKSCQAGDEAISKNVQALQVRHVTEHSHTEYSQHADMTPSDSNTAGGSDIAEETAIEEPLDEEAEIERRRRRRAELLKKSRANTPLHVQVLTAESVEPSAATSPQQSTCMNTPRTPGTGKINVFPRNGHSTDSSGPQSPASPAPGTPSQSMFEIADDRDLSHKAQGSKDNDDEPSAADYDPTVDMREDERRDEARHGNVDLHGQAVVSAEKPSLLEVAEPVETIEPKENENEDDFDMFAEDFDEEKLKVKPVVKVESKAEIAAPAPEQRSKAAAILEDDDRDGYYKIRTGDILGGRYQIEAGLGKGMFSGVARAIDVTTKQPVAVKIMRNNDALKKGGFTEIAILEKLNATDPEDKKHIVKFIHSFDHKGHLCLVFENLSMNLREVLKKFGNNVGINIGATRAYAYQIFLALAHMRRSSIIHADLKPDNILINDARNTLKICDLGTAIDRSDAATAHNEITPYLVSRFYRAPEIMLGAPYEYSVDVWSIGCTLYELYTGRILFTGDSNNQMLKTIMEIRGKISAKLYRRGQLWQMHFDGLGNFLSQERDKVSGKTSTRSLARVTPTRDLRTRLLAASGRMDDTEARQLNLFLDLLDRCLNVNPDKRITPSEALKHPFFAQKSNAAGKT